MKRARKNKFGIRKLSIGVCSVVVGMSFLASHQVLAEENTVETDSLAVNSTREDLDAISQPAILEESFNPESLDSLSEQPSEEGGLPLIDYASLSKDVTGWEFSGDEVTKVENQSFDKSSTLKYRFDTNVRDHLKDSKSGTIYVEYRVPSDAKFHSIFNATSSSNENHYTSIYANAGAVGLEARTNTKNELKSGKVGIRNGEWNAIALTYDKPEDSSTTAVKLYVNGLLSDEGNFSKGLFSEIPDFSYVQLGEAQRATNPRWGANGMLIRNATLYNRALTEEEIKQRSALFMREVYTAPVRDGEELTEKIPVFEGGRGEQRNPQGVHAYRIPALLKTDKGTLIAAIDERNSGSGDWGDIATVVKRSTDNGQTWGETIKIVDLKNSSDGPNYLDPFTIDPALVQDPTSKRIFALFDMMPDHVGENKLGGSHGLGESYVEPYSTIGDKKYLNLYKDGQQYTVREDGRVFTSDGQVTDYRVNVNDESQHFANLGDLYKGKDLVGNIYFQHANGEHAFKVAKTMYIVIPLQKTLFRQATTDWY